MQIYKNVPIEPMIYNVAYEALHELLISNQHDVMKLAEVLCFACDIYKQGLEDEKGTETILNEIMGGLMNIKKGFIEADKVIAERKNND